MKQALKQAEKAFAEEEVPIGCVVVAQNQIIGKGYNQVEKLNDPTAHAEMLAITAASTYLGSKYLNECDIYITVEPCLMCYGAIKNARIKNIFIGCLEPKHGFNNFINNTKGISVQKRILESESKELMKLFFVDKR